MDLTVIKKSANDLFNFTDALGLIVCDFAMVRLHFQMLDSFVHGDIPEFDLSDRVSVLDFIHHANNELSSCIFKLDNFHSEYHKTLRDFLAYLRDEGAL